MRTTGPGQSALLLLDVIAVLNESQVDYAVVGAMAASFYGPVRASLDADAVMSFKGATTLQTLDLELKKAGFDTQLRRGDFDDPISAVLAAADRHGNRVDLLVGLRGMEAAAFARAVETQFMNEPVRIIGLEDFIAMKIFADSPKDVDDARNAIAISGHDLDTGLLKKVARQYGAAVFEAAERLLAEAPKTHE